MRRLLDWLRMRDVRLRALAIAVVPLTSLPVLFAVWLADARIVEIEANLRERGESLARQVAAASEGGVFAGNREQLQRLADVAARERGVRGVAIEDGRGELLARAGEPVQAGPFAFGAPVVLRADAPEAMFLGVFEGANSDGRSIGQALVQLSATALEESRAGVVRLALVVGLVGLAAALALALVLARSVTGPIQQLAATVSRIGEGDLAARTPSGSAGAIGALERGINDMAARVERARDELAERIRAATFELQLQKDAAEQSNRVKTQFLAAASHDLRQPLQALGLFVMSLKMEVKGGESERMIERIEHALEAVQTVLEALLDISRLDAGIVTPRLERFPAQRLLERMAELYGAAADRYGLQLSVVKTSLWIESDRGLLERIVANLVSNAVRYTPAGRIVIGCRREGLRVRIEIHDSGPGIPPEKRGQIFREFVQLGEGQESREKGLGLGLAIVERLCRLLGHELRLDSMVGRGSAFAVLVNRVARGEEVLDRGAGALRPSLSNRVILVIDDDPAVQEALVRIIDGHGASTLAAANLAEAEQLVDEVGLAPDFILCDFTLRASVDGLSVVAALRARYGAEIPAAILTGDIVPRVLRRVREADLALFSKPARGEELIGYIAASIK